MSEDLMHGFVAGMWVSILLRDLGAYIRRRDGRTPR